MQHLPQKKTKIVCTIGPASQSPAVLRQLIAAGMNVARINFAHGSLEMHREVIANIRAAAGAVGSRVAIMGDLPGPKMRVGIIDPEPVELERGQSFILQTEPITGNRQRVSHSFADLSQVVKTGNSIFLNDGFVELAVEEIVGTEIFCRVVVGGPLGSRKGINVPHVDLGILAFTESDEAFLRFAAGEGLDAVSQSFVQNAADIEAVRAAAAAMNYSPFIIAKIERAGALERMDEILASADGIMVARGDLGVEIPVEQVAIAQKHLIGMANRLGKPVITATHMLESMISNRRPTRAEVSDVANAIFDGADCVMLSGETAVGMYPVEAVSLMSRIAVAVEAEPDESLLGTLLRAKQESGIADLEDLISLNMYASAQTLSPAVILIPTHTGSTARRLARFRLPMWIVAFAPDECVCQQLQFTYGVFSQCVAEQPQSWLEFARDWSQDYVLDGSLAILMEGSGTLQSGGTRRIDVLDLRGETAGPLAQSSLTP